MNPFAWLIGLLLPACGLPAVQGLPTPPLTDLGQIVRPDSPNTALAAPAGFSPSPDIVTPPYQVSADRLFALIREVAASQPRTYQAAVYPERLQADYVARSLVFNFPDRVVVQVDRSDADRSFLIIYSRSVYGRSDFGVNRRRVETWLAVLKAKIPLPIER